MALLTLAFGEVVTTSLGLCIKMLLIDKRWPFVGSDRPVRYLSHLNIP